MSEVELEEGTYYEKVFGPVSVTISRDPDTDERLMSLVDSNGEEMTIVGRKLITKVCYYMRKYTSFKGQQTCKPMLSLQDDELTAELQSAMNVGLVKEKPVEIKILTDNNGEVSSITSPVHRQISWSKLRHLIQKPIQELFGDVEAQEFGTGRWSYRLPVKNPYVSSWVGVDVGNNLAQGRSGIRLFTRFRTESKGFNGSAPCLNWANLWQTPIGFFNVDLERLPWITQVVGPKHIQNLQMKEIHIKDTVDRIGELEDEIKAHSKAMVKALNKFKRVINKSVKAELTLKEMEAILQAYAVKVKLPKYIIEQIINEVRSQRQPETVWGFSNAISYVRTHGEFRETKRSLTIEDRQLVQKLEMIAGEVLSLTPTISALKEQVGEITTEVLIPPVQAKA